MDILEFKRAVRTLTEITHTDKAVVVGIVHENGQVVIRNMGDIAGRGCLYRALRLALPSIDLTVRPRTTGHVEKEVAS